LVLMRLSPVRLMSGPMRRWEPQARLLGMWVLMRHSEPPVQSGPTLVQTQHWAGWARALLLPAIC
jgi:hypothetical protein